MSSMKNNHIKSYRAHKQHVPKQHNHQTSNQPIHNNISSTKTNKNMEEDRETLIDPTLYETYLDVLDLNIKEVDNLNKQGYCEISDVETMSDETLRQMLISRDIRASRCERLKAFRTWLREQEAKYTKK
jgi:hypothetical protein